MKKLAFSILISLIVLNIICYAQAIKGKPAPGFSVTSGDNETITFNQLSNKVVIIFYETKDKEVLALNKNLKNELRQFIENVPDSVISKIVRVPVIDCRKASWLSKSIWKSKLAQSSKRKNLIIYGDWDGEFAQKYKISDNNSNFTIIDKNGIIQYKTSGKIPEQEFPGIINLINKLAAKD
ncbi:MAG: redoxin domain-containing protein [Candidatus Marinimicrobia bacterium]|nr:redoxin domain-containing protein [Candidatus Neomarinimicrobiota bacterium]